MRLHLEVAQSWDLPLPFSGRIPAVSWVGRPLPSSQASIQSISLARSASFGSDVFALHHVRRMVAHASFRVGRPKKKIIQKDQQMSEIILPSSWKSSSCPPILGLVARQFLGWSPTARLKEHPTAPVACEGRPPVLGLVAR